MLPSGLVVHYIDLYFLYIRFKRPGEPVDTSFLLSVNRPTLTLSECSTPRGLVVVFNQPVTYFFEIQPFILMFGTDNIK